MVDLDAGIDFRHLDPLAGCDLVHIGEMPGAGARLQRVQWIVVREHVEQVHRLDRFHAGVLRQLVDDSRDRIVCPRIHHEAIDA
ncbi:MAG: hypothetical protein E6H71_10940 [Betaproteobacteria bacterium]|nr:MAG: hypothetical protein E6H71_10940 [Betaproteobacteria bacterium]